MNMDNELRDALRRKQAPEDLADRVLARITEEPARPGQTKPRAENVLRWLAAAAVVALAAGAADRYYLQQREAAETARAQEEIRIALQITSDTLARVQSKMSQPAEDQGR
jgi:hypothetical protein